MKLKFRGNILRIRLNKEELDTFGTTGKVEDSIQHGSSPAESLNYSIERGDYPQIEACYSPELVRIFVPNDLAFQWVHSRQSNIEQNISFNPMRIRVEKDYSCLHGRGGEEEDLRSDHPPGTLRIIP